jgi:transcription termination factor 2
MKECDNSKIHKGSNLILSVCLLISRRMRWAGHVARMGKDIVVHRVFVGKPEGKRPLGRLRRRWEDNIKMNLQDVGRTRRDLMELAQDRDRWRALVGTVRDFRVP